VPKDEFERLERRWRERPLFLEEPRRSPVWTLALLLLCLGVFLGFAAVGPSGLDRLVARFTTGGAAVAAAQDAGAVPIGLDTAVTTAER
jgi:hypothetical protein